MTITGPSPVPPGRARRSGPDELRLRVLARAIAVAAVAGPLISLVVLIGAAAQDCLNLLTIGLSAYALSFTLLWLCAGRLSYHTRAGIYLGLVLCTALVVQLRGGVGTAATALELVSLVLSGLLFGTRGVACALAGTLGIFLVSGIAVVGELVPPIALKMWDPTLPEVWIRGALVLSLFGGMAALAVTYMIDKLEQDAELLREALLREQAQRQARERAEAEREVARAALDRAQRVEEIGRLAGGVAHEYNNALTVILASADAARGDPDLDDDTRECLDEITRTAYKSAQLTRSLLALGRRDVSQPEVVDVAKLLHPLAASLARALRPEIELVVATDSAGEVHVDRSELERVVANLVLNACDAIPDEGRIELRCETVALEPGLLGLAGGRYVAIRVRDNGRGMDDEVRRRLFEPFFSTKPPGRGAGLGMALVQSFAAFASGAVDVVSAEGVGSTVSLVLPARMSDVAAAPVARSALVRRERCSVLVVEDDAQILASFERALERAGFAVHAAATSDHALDLLTDPSLPVDLVCLDAVLPGVGSERVLEQARALHPDARILVCSGYIEGDLLRDQIRAGAIALLRKPFSADVLVERVRKELGLA